MRFGSGTTGAIECLVVGRGYRGTHCYTRARIPSSPAEVRMRLSLWLRSCVFVALAVAGGACAGSDQETPQAVDTRPNIIVIQADDLGYGRSEERRVGKERECRGAR